MRLYTFEPLFLNTLYTQRRTKVTSEKTSIYCNAPSMATHFESKVGYFVSQVIDSSILDNNCVRHRRTPTDGSCSSMSQIRVASHPSISSGPEKALKRMFKLPRTIHRLVGKTIPFFSKNEILVKKFPIKKLPFFVHFGTSQGSCKIRQKKK